MFTADQESSEPTTETLVKPQTSVVCETDRAACLVHIYPTGPSMGKRYPLAQEPVIIGRGSVCQIRIEDHSVSRRHAGIVPKAGGHQAIDLESTNGTYVNETLTNQCHLQDGDYLRIGSCIYRYLVGGNIEAEYHEEIYRLAIIDALTAIPNRRNLMDFLERELARSTRHERPLSLILIDIDHFKSINDQHGHLCGDYVLRELSACFKSVIRKEEMIARFGGEEFAVVLPECTAANAMEVAERLRAMVEAYPFNLDGKIVKITISLGLASTSGREALTADDLIQRADQKLYEAKESGRNCLGK